jgi:hypothetical protein
MTPSLFCLKGIVRNPDGTEALYERSAHYTLCDSCEDKIDITDEDLARFDPSKIHLCEPCFKSHMEQITNTGKTVLEKHN